ncbi:glycosyltransferase 61 family protein [Arthrobacter sp. zg-Y179]|uniref:glycosyltransferase 61 family protein n=1 Tax=Arthrobacter sp. zg-Y179 TaxID=2894188 RepID=UPI003FA4AA71
MPSISTYDSALLTANVLDDENASANGALYDSKGRLLVESVRAVDRTDSHIPGDPASVPRPSAVVGHYNHPGYDTYIDEAIFGGHIFAGWGHTITETISSAWASTEVPQEVPLVMVPWGRLWVSALPRIRETMALAGWGDRPLIMTVGTAVFGKVHVPERLVRFDDLLHRGASIPAEMNAVYDLMIGRSTLSDPRPRIPTFLARTRGHRRAHPYEEAIEAALAERGFRVVEGWDLGVREQIALINSSSCLVAFSGSSLHNSVFAERSIPVLEIMDNRASSTSLVERPLQAALCELREQPFTRVQGYDNGQARTVPDVVEEVMGLCVSLA